MLYKTTKEFLVQFGLKDLNELPTPKEFEELGRLEIVDEVEAQMQLIDPEELNPTPAEAVAAEADAEAEAAAETEPEAGTRFVAQGTPACCGFLAHASSNASGAQTEVRASGTLDSVRHNGANA